MGVCALLVVQRGRNGAVRFGGVLRADAAAVGGDGGLLLLFHAAALADAPTRGKGLVAARGGFRRAGRRRVPCRRHGMLLLCRLL